MYFEIAAHGRVYSIGYETAYAYFPSRIEKKKNEAVRRQKDKKKNTQKKKTLKTFRWSKKNT